MKIIKKAELIFPCKIDVTNHSNKAVQEILIKKGCRWLDGSKYFLDSGPFLFVNSDKIITHVSSNDYGYFLGKNYPEISAYDILHKY